MKAIYHNLHEIPKLAFEGYVWMSDKSTPEIFQPFDFEKVGTNPFVIEALLYCKETNVSIHIQHAGTYHIAEYDLTSLEKEGALLEEKSYLPHRLAGTKKLVFKQVWLEERDDLCEDMPVLKLKAIVFCGFNNND